MSVVYSKLVSAMVVSFYCAGSFAQANVYRSFVLQVSKTLIDKKTNLPVVAENSKIEKMTGVAATFRDPVNNKTFEIQIFDPVPKSENVPRVVLGLSTKSAEANESRAKRIISSEGSYYNDESRILFNSVDVGGGVSLMKVLEGSSGDDVTTADLTITARSFPDGTTMIAYWNDKLKIPYGEGMEVTALRSEYYYDVVTSPVFLRNLPIKIQNKIIEFAFLHTRIFLLQKDAEQCAAHRLDCSVKQMELKAADEDRDKLFFNLIMISDLNVVHRRVIPIRKQPVKNTPQVWNPFARY